MTMSEKLLQKTNESLAGSATMLNAKELISRIIYDIEPLILRVTKNFDPSDRQETYFALEDLKTKIKLGSSKIFMRD